MEFIILMILIWAVKHDIHWYLFGIVFLLMLCGLTNATRL